ncbi:MAG: EfeM/EfeO family lipoprotein [Moorea sp. SIO1G6]|uniref:EfeM/EfeO family lipoprotein n=1 Tax=Moorena sp. SIO1G6 TaxID=2607840 RepID=UPI0013C065E7|nr:EfeM/EfeO family lipoprotein [Moorena sp. SIO1G6]NET64359.1 EfeM/EfeO family lipoprotein [Moorena sp. SIO1G6]
MTINRRKILQITAVGGLGTLAASSLIRPGSSKELIAAAGRDPYAAEVDQGLRYFRQQAQVQLPLVEDLVKAIRSGNLENAKDAYVKARPPYEQIETYAASFEDTDRDIDARPSAFDGGEDNPEFKGFHRIEVLLYRERKVKPALPYAKELVESVKTLIKDLDQRQNFNSTLNFEGMIALATEVVAKKICGEEETWSDQSLLIFSDNWIGIFSQYAPYSAKVADKDPSVDQEVKAAYKAAKGKLKPYFTQGEVAAQPYSSLDISQRKDIVDVGYRFRRALYKAAKVLELPIGFEV